MATLVDFIRALRSPETQVVHDSLNSLRATGWLQDGSLQGVVLCHAHMEGADLQRANLQKVDLHQAHMQACDLSHSDLRQAKLTRTNLAGADFSDANLEQADFFKADLRQAKNLTDEQLIRARRLCFATMPDGSTYDGRFNLQGDLELARWGHVDVGNPEAMAYFLGVSTEHYLEGQARRDQPLGVV